MYSKDLRFHRSRFKLRIVITKVLYPERMGKCRKKKVLVEILRRSDKIDYGEIYYKTSFKLYLIMLITNYL